MSNTILGCFSVVTVPEKICTLYISIDLIVTDVLLLPVDRGGFMIVLEEIWRIEELKMNT